MAIDKILGKMIDETNKEIAASVWNRESLVHDKTGDRHIEGLGAGLEGQHEPPDDDDDPVEVEGETPLAETESEEGNEGEEPAEPEEPEKPPKTEPRGRKDGRVPSGVHREMSDRARAAEAERDALKATLEELRAKSKSDLEAVNSKFDQVMQALARQAGQSVPQTAEPPEQIPDLFENPQGYAEFMQRGFQRELAQRDQKMELLRIEMSMENAHARHGEAFSAAYDALSKMAEIKTQENIEIGRRILRSPNPGEALVRWHKQNETLRLIGDDPDKYRQTIADETRQALMADPEFRKMLVDELKGEAMTANNGRPRTETRFPPSLHGAAGGNPRRNDILDFDGTPQGIADSVWRK